MHPDTTEHDFWDGMRDDADDALVRHAYADWCDEHGDAEAGEYYRLCGDAIDAEPWSVDEELIAARIDRLSRTVFEPRLRAVAPALVNKFSHGLIRLNHDIRYLPVWVWERLARIPLYGAELNRARGDQLTLPDHDWGWLRSLTVSKVNGVLLLADARPELPPRLRELIIAKQGWQPLARAAELCPGLHALQLREPLTDRGAKSFRDFANLRHLRLDRVHRSGEGVLSALPDTLQTLRVGLDNSLAAFHRSESGSVAFPNLKRVIVGVPWNESECSLSGLAKSRLLRHVEHLGFGRASENTLRVGQPAGPPPALRRLRITGWESLPLMQAFTREWGAQLKAFFAITWKRERASRLRPLLDSESLRELAVPADAEFLNDLSSSPLGPRLESLALTAPVTKPGLDALATCKLPALRRLELCLSPDGFVDRELYRLTGAAVMDGLEVLHLRASSATSRIEFPADLPACLGERLRVLRLDANLLGETLVDSLVNSDLPTRLDRLAIAGRPQDEGEERLCTRLADAFPESIRWES